jgi:hypothetical protein
MQPGIGAHLIHDKAGNVFSRDRSAVEPEVSARVVSRPGLLFNWLRVFPGNGIV